MTEGEVVTYGCGNAVEVSVCHEALSGWWSGHEAQICKETDRRTNVNEVATRKGEGGIIRG